MFRIVEETSNCLFISSNCWYFWSESIYWCFTIFRKNTSPKKPTPMSTKLKMTVAHQLAVSVEQRECVIHFMV